MTNKFVDSCDVKIRASGFHKLLESIFCSCWLWTHFPWKKLSRCLKCSCLARGQVNVVDEARLRSPISFPCEALALWRAVGRCEKNRGHSVDQCWLQVVPLSVHLIGFLSILTRCNGFAGTQKAVVDQTGSRPPNSGHDLFCCKFGFRQGLGASCQSNHWIGCHWLSYKIQFLLHITIWLRNDSFLLYIKKRTLKNDNFFILWSPHEASTYWAFSPTLLQMPNDHRMVDTEPFGNFLCSCKRTGLSDPLNWSLSTSVGHPLCSSSLSLSSPLQNFLNHHCTECLLAVPGPGALLMLQIVSAALWPILNSNKNITQIWFLSNIFSLV